MKRNIEIFSKHGTPRVVAMEAQGRARRSLETQKAEQTLCQQNLVVLASLLGLGQVPVLCLPPNPVFGAGRREGKAECSPTLRPYLIDAKADGMHVLAHLPLPPPVLLDEAHQEGTASLPILIIFIFFLQLDEVLRVHPEGIYGSGTEEHSLE